MPMSILRKTVAAVGFVCFFSVALLPVSMSICGPVMWRMLLHHAKHSHHPTGAALAHPVASKPQQGSILEGLERDVIPVEDSVRSLVEHTGIARNPVDFGPKGPEIYASQGFVKGTWVSGFASHTVLIL